MENDSVQVTALLQQVRAGDESALEKAVPVVYKELHRLARSYMRGERAGHTLQPTALVNEAFLRLCGSEYDYESRSHFVGVAGTIMRHILVDHAKSRSAARRGGGVAKMQLNEALEFSVDRPDEVIAISEALDELSKAKSRQARVVELRFFAGLSVEEIADVLKISPRSVKADWALARLWLFDRLSSGIQGA